MPLSVEVTTMYTVRPCRKDERSVISEIINAAAEAYPVGAVGFAFGFALAFGLGSSFALVVAAAPAGSKPI